MQTLSVCMIVQNAQNTLAIALESLGHVYDELIIVDGGSTDLTCDIALSYGARIIHSKWSGDFSKQRNLYLQEVKTDWVFVIDSDEFIDKKTLDLLATLKKERIVIDTDNFVIPRRWISPFSQKHYISSAPHYPDVQHRLFKYQKNLFYEGLIHHQLAEFKQEAGILINLSIYHLDLFINSEAKRQEKVRRYSDPDPRNGARHFYLPSIKYIEVKEWDYEDILPSVTSLLNNLVNDSFNKSSLNNIIPAEIKDDQFYSAIEKIAKEENIKTVLEIGSSSGAGSTEAFVKGLSQNPNHPTLFCMEVSKNRFTELQKRYSNDLFVKCYNISSVSPKHFPSENEVIEFYNSTRSNLNFYPLEVVLDWLRQDIVYVKCSGVEENGIKKIKEENQIDFFDVVLIDGSEFSGSLELAEVYGAKFILLDDIQTFKNYKNHQRLLEDKNYKLVEQNNLVRNGYSIFKRTDEKNNIDVAELGYETENLPIHFFTIVLNGEPFIRYHIKVFQQLPFQWHWHIVEGVAALKHDTAWSVPFGGSVSDEIHNNGRSNDGTTEYLDELAQLYPGKVTVYRQPEGVFWNGKREMVNEPLFNIDEECLLWQLDVDELWTVEQIYQVRRMFIEQPEKTAAFYWCWYFVGENLVISTRNCYAENPQIDWLRNWRYKPGFIWVAHEPPTLEEPLLTGEWRDVAAIDPFSHEETEKRSLVFQHFAYAMQKQLQFKEQYYGYKNAVEKWILLQKQNQFPVLLRQYFSWVGDDTMVDTAESCGVVPIAKKEVDGNWQFLPQASLQLKPVEIKNLSPKIIVDGVFFQIYNTGIARVWKSLLTEWAENGFGKHIVVIDRNRTAPIIPGIKYRSVPPYSYSRTDADREMLQQICDEENADIFISTYYTTPRTTPSVFMAYDMIPEVLNGNLNEPMWREKHFAINHAASYITISQNTANDLIKCFPDIDPDSVTVAHCGVNNTLSPATQEEIHNFQKKYGIAKPYFIFVGSRSGYKNGTLFFQAFGKLHSKEGFDIVCTGFDLEFEDEFRTYTSGSTVYMLTLNDEELKAAYSGAVALVFPSVYEGFGLPVLEALACGCPVITSPNASLPEVAGEAAIYVEHTDIYGMANALCDVQKPAIRDLLITAGLAQAKNFSWANMAQKVRSVLIQTSLLSLNLRDVNIIIFPDYSISEESLYSELAGVMRILGTHPDRNQINLLIDTSNIPEDLEIDENLILSSVVMNLLIEEELDITDGLEISTVGNLSSIQWEFLLPRIQNQIILEYENEARKAEINAENIPACELDNISQKRVVKLETGVWDFR